MPFYLLVHIRVLTEVHLFACPVLKPLLSTYLSDMLLIIICFNAWQLLAVRSLWRFYSGRGRETSLSPLSLGSAPPLTGSCVFFLSQGAYLCDKCVFPCGCVGVCVYARAGFTWLPWALVVGGGEWGGSAFKLKRWLRGGWGDSSLTPAGWENRRGGLWLSHRLVSLWQGTDMSAHIYTTRHHLDRKKSVQKYYV